MGRLLVSADLTSDRTSATGGCPRFALPGRAALPGSAASIVASPLHGDLLVSADLTADEISATGGHRRFVPRQGALHPGPIPPMELVLENKLYSAVTPRNRGFRPKKAKKNPRESARVFPGIYSSAFPDALHPVWRPKDAGPEVTCYQLGGIFKHLRETVCFSRQAASAAGGVRGGTPSPVGTGAKPRRSPLW